MHSRATIAIRYALFAAAATCANLTTQWAGLRVYGGPLSLLVAMALGTASGLAVKYVLDKRWIFNDLSTGLRTHMRKFSLYTLTGVATTAVFWGTELLFDAAAPADETRLIGGALGLVIGYSLKYWLDRCFVFNLRLHSTPGSPH
jgi:putative flippase GtrA